MPDSSISVMPRSSVMFSCWLRLFVTCAPTRNGMKEQEMADIQCGVPLTDRVCTWVQISRVARPPLFPQLRHPYMFVVYAAGLSDCDAQQVLVQQLLRVGEVELTKSSSPGSAAARRHWQSSRVYRVELQKY